MVSRHATLSRPARFYLAGPVACRYFSVVATGLIFPSSLALVRYIPIVNWVPTALWLVLITVIGAAAVVVALPLPITPTPTAARVVLAASATVTFVVGLGLELVLLYLARLPGPFPSTSSIVDNATPIVAALIISLSAADYTVLAFRLEVPESEPALSLPPRLSPPPPPA